MKQKEESEMKSSKYTIVFADKISEAMKTLTPDQFKVLLFCTTQAYQVEKEADGDTKISGGGQATISLRTIANGAGVKFNSMQSIMTALKSIGFISVEVSRGWASGRTDGNTYNVSNFLVTEDVGPKRSGCQEELKPAPTRAPQEVAREYRQNWQQITSHYIQHADALKASYEKALQGLNKVAAN